MVSVTQFNSGFTTNVIPETATLSGTTRSFLPEVQDAIEAALRRIARGIAEAHGAEVEVTYDRRYPATINAARETEFAAGVAQSVVGPENLRRDLPPVMGAEDFGWMLREKPGCYIWLGNGAGGAPVHNPNYDFNDDVLAIGASYWSKLVETLLPAELPTG